MKYVKLWLHVLGVGEKKDYQMHRNSDMQDSESIKHQASII